MITQEQAERFVDKVNRVWKDRGARIALQGKGIHVFDVDEGGSLAGFRGGTVFWLGDCDGKNAQFIVWAWDRLCEFGIAPYFTNSHNGWAIFKNDRAVMDGITLAHDAPTRAEAVFLALLEALESTTQTDALAIPDSSSAAQSTAAEGEQKGGPE